MDGCISLRLGHNKRRDGGAVAAIPSDGRLQHRDRSKSLWWRSWSGFVDSCYGLFLQYQQRSPSSQGRPAFPIPYIILALVVQDEIFYSSHLIIYIAVWWHIGRVDAFSTGGSWVRSPLWAPRRIRWNLGYVLHLVACRASACKLRHSVNCCGRERFWKAHNVRSVIAIDSLHVSTIQCNYRSTVGDALCHWLTNKTTHFLVSLWPLVSSRLAVCLYVSSPLNECYI